MAPQFSEDTLSLIKDRLLVSEVINRRVVLKQKGKDFLGLCPFHQEKTPSFTVNNQKGFYHCFGCGAHGDIFSFLTDYEKLTFYEAVEHCASLAGVPLQSVHPDQEKFRNERDTLFKVLEDAKNLFQDTLKQPMGQRYYDYLISRGITEKSIEIFQLGVAIKGRLMPFMSLHHISSDMLHKAGLITDYDHGHKEKFFDRLMFPIVDEKKRVVGFGGRTLSPDIQPKYLNSAENELFHKGHLLYGMQLMDYKTPSVILVEGYLDVIAMVQAGFKNVFAPMGTAVTPDQAKKVLKHFNKIYICFDGDSAGFKAMNRAADIFLQFLQPGIEILFLRLPDGEDPHSLISTHRQDKLHDLFNTPLSLIEFLKLYEAFQSPGNNPSMLALQRKRILDRLNILQDSFLKSLYKDQVYKLFHVKKTMTPSLQGIVVPKLLPLQKIYEAVILKAFMICPELYEDFIDQLQNYPFSLGTQTILSRIENYIFSEHALEFSAMYTYIQQQVTESILDDILDESLYIHAPFLKGPFDKYRLKTGIEGILEHFEHNKLLNAHIKEAQDRFKHSQNTEDWQRLKVLMAEKTQLNDNER